MKSWDAEAKKAMKQGYQDNVARGAPPISSGNVDYWISNWMKCFRIYMHKMSGKSFAWLLNCYLRTVIEFLTVQEPIYRTVRMRTLN
jgi:hypothetical protein